MFQNMFLNWLTGMVGKKLDGQKTKIGGVALILAALCQLALSLFPDLTIPGVEHVDWDTTLGMLRDGLAALGVAFGATGVAHKAFKAGLETPAPPEPMKYEELERKVNDRKDPRIPGQML